MLNLARAPLSLVLALLFGLATYVFYATPFQGHVEEYLFDVRTRLKPQRKAVPDLVLVTIDERTIERAGGGAGGRFPVAALRAVTDALRQSRARRIAVLLFPNIYDFEDPAFPGLVASLAADDRVVVGALGVYGDSPSGVDLPRALRPLAARTFGVDTLRPRSNSVVRALPLRGYLGKTRRAMLAPALAQAVPAAPLATAAPARLLDVAADGRDWYALNYLAPASFRQIDAAALAADPGRYADELAGRTVLVGQTAFREWMTQTREQTSVNTAVKRDVDTYLGGESIVFLTANAVENLRTRSWLAPAGALVAVAQTVGVTLAFAAVWAAGVVWAVVTVTVGWLLLLVAHAALFHYAAVFIPLADTALFSTFAVLGGAVARLNLDIRAQAQARAAAAATSAVARAHSRYLERFSRAMAAANDAARTRLHALAHPPAAAPPGAADQDLLARALATSADFAEYLQGIMQCADAEASAGGAVEIERLRLAPLIATVVQRLEAQVAERRIALTVECAAGLAVRSNAHLLDNIVFNLLSNAVKYSREGGRVAVVARPHGRGAVVTVADDGPGIAPEFQDKIFEKFYRVRNDDVYKIKGSGLGLYLCRYFAGLIDATVSCRSAVGSGATFIVELGRRR